MSAAPIDSIAALEAVAGKTPGAMHLKVIDHLDRGALRWLAASPLMFACFGDESGLQVTPGGGAPGFASGSRGELLVPASALDDPSLARPGAAFGSLFLIPSIGEMLRVNGTVTGVANGLIAVAVQECYGHCAKALIRSSFWQAGSVDSGFERAADLVVASKFMTLATMADGHADVSPKGDSAGCLAQMDGDTLWFADRPGNRRMDSFRNLVAHPQVALALLCPGALQVVLVRGKAELTTDEDMRRRFAVREKMPQLAIRVAVEELEFRASAALERVCPWPPTDAPEGIEPARLFMEHIRLNRSGGLTGRIASAVMAVPGAEGLVKKGLEKDYKSNLY